MVFDIFCYIEVFDEETKQWNYMFKSDNPEPINQWYYNLEVFFGGFDLAFLFEEIHKQKDSNAVDKYKGLPKDCSQEIVKAHHFYVEEVKMCERVSYLDLTDLLVFDYEKTFDVSVITEKEYCLYQFDFNKCKNPFIPHKEWLGEDYFVELQKTKLKFSTYSKCRLVYFVWEVDLET
jgi:hypothetical protein